MVFIPKYRRKVLYGEIRQSLGAIFHELARQKECRIVEGHLLPDHGPLCIEIPPKYAVASVSGFLKGKSSLAIARQGGGKSRNFTGEHFWARGYAVSTVGYELEAVKRYIRLCSAWRSATSMCRRVLYSIGYKPFGLQLAKAIHSHRRRWGLRWYVDEGFCFRGGRK